MALITSDRSFRSHKHAIDRADVSQRVRGDEDFHRRKSVDLVSSGCNRTQTRLSISCNKVELPIPRKSLSIAIKMQHVFAISVIVQREYGEGLLSLGTTLLTKPTVHFDE